MAHQLSAVDERAVAPPPESHVSGRQSRAQRAGEALLVWMIRVGAVVGVLAAWEWLLAPNLSPLAFTSASKAFEATWTFVTDGPFWSASWFTMKSTLIGLALGAVVGTTLAMLWVLRFPPGVTTTLEPFIAGFYAMPRIAFLPVLALVVGRGLATVLIYIISGVMIYIFFSVRAGLLERDSAAEDAIRLMGGSERDVLRYIQFPRIAGSLVTGLLIAAPFAIQMALMAELLIGTQGLGYQLSYGKSFRIVGLMFAAIISASFWTLVIDRMARIGLTMMRRLHVAE